MTDREREIPEREGWRENDKDTDRCRDTGRDREKLSEKNIGKTPLYQKNRDREKDRNHHTSKNK